MNEKRKSGYEQLKELARAQKNAQNQSDRPKKATNGKPGTGPKRASDSSRSDRTQARSTGRSASAGPDGTMRAKRPERPEQLEFGANEYGVSSGPSTQKGVQKLTLDERSEGQRLDNFLLRELKGAPRSLIYRIVRSGEVRVNGGRAKPTQRLTAGDIVRVPPLRLGDSVAASPESNRVEWLQQHILDDSRELLVLNKPSGLASHGGSGISFGAIEALRAIFPDDLLELVHRLDRDTSGLLLVARKRSVLTELQELMKTGRMRKRYFTLVVGQPPNDRFDCKLSLKKFELAGGERVVKISDQGKPSLTYFHVLERFPDHNLSLIEATLGTGRTHQIRVHAQGSGFPVAGDDKYGDSETNLKLQKLGLRRLFLHAAHLSWKSETGNKQFEAPLPTELEAVLQKLRQTA